MLTRGKERWGGAARRAFPRLLYISERGAYLRKGSGGLTKTTPTPEMLLLSAFSTSGSPVPEVNGSS